MDLFIPLNNRGFIDCYAVYAARHLRTILPNHTLSCPIWPVFSWILKKSFEFWTSRPPSQLPLYHQCGFRTLCVPFGSYRLPACRYPSDPSGSLSANLCPRDREPTNVGGAVGGGGCPNIFYFLKRYIRSWTVLTGRAQSFYDKDNHMLGLRPTPNSNII